jgi:hypothetical protein
MPTNELTEKIREIESLIYKESLHELVANIIMDKAGVRLLFSS